MAMYVFTTCRLAASCLCDWHAQRMYALYDVVEVGEITLDKFDAHTRSEFDDIIDSVAAKIDPLLNH